MWDLLAEFPDRRIEWLYDDAEPMAKLVKTLRKKPYARSVYAFTSLRTFVLTLQAAYSFTPSKDEISIRFERHTGNFLIGYGDVKYHESVGYMCPAKQAESLLDAFVLRLFLTEHNDVLTPEPELFPSFRIGQEVETILDAYSRKYHRGTVCEIVKHEKQNRFMYFIEEKGKKLKKRYFKNNLKII